MTKRYTMLQKKLQQLQTELAQVFTLPAETTSCSHQLISEGIEQRLDFLKNLLSAEIASSDHHPSSKPPQHLLHVDQRLNELESAFRKWEDYCNSIYINNNNVADHDDASVCSCSESFLNEEYGETSSQMDDVPEFGSSTVCELPSEGFYGPAVGGGGKEEAPPVEKVVMKRDKLRRAWTWIRYCGKMVLYMLVGAILIVKFLSSSTDHHQGSLTPT